MLFAQVEDKKTRNRLLAVFIPYGRSQCAESSWIVLTPGIAGTTCILSREALAMWVDKKVGEALAIFTDNFNVSAAGKTREEMTCCSRPWS